MNKFVFSRQTFERLINHLVNIEENKDELLEIYFPEPSKSRKEFISILDNYIVEVNKLLQNTHVAKSTDNSFPFVIIGSEVEVKDMDEQRFFKFRIASPFEQIGSDDVSFLSPVGMSLLLKEVGEEVVVVTPGCRSNYRVQSIKFHINRE